MNPIKAARAPRLPVTLRYALHNLVRNRRRTFLSAAGIAVGCAIALVNIGMVKGKTDMFIRNVAEGGAGHLKIVPKGWLVDRNPMLRLEDWTEVLGNLRGDPKVAVATPSTRIQAMLAMGTRMVGVDITGVDPDTEPQAYRYVRTIQSGRYLAPGESHAMVVGKSVADRLRIGVGDRVVATVVDGQGAMKSDLFEVVGIVSLGNRQLDEQVCQVVRADVDALSGLAGVGEITVLLKDSGETDKEDGLVRSRLPAGDEALTWSQISPQSETAVRINLAMAKFVTAFLVFVAFLGVVSAQLTAVLERRKELAVLTALGMGRSSVLKLVFSEAAALGILSALATMALGGPVTWYLAAHGIVVLDGKSVSAFGSAVDPVLHGEFGAWFFGYAVALSCAATLLASAYPAWFATSLEPAEALRSE